MYGKLKNGALYIAPTPLKIDGWDVFTNDPRVYLANGYKPVEFADYPSDGKSYVGSWTETETELTQVWTAAEPIEDISADEATAEQMEAALKQIGGAIDESE